MPARLIRVLVVDDYEPFRRFFCSTLKRRTDLQIITEVSDGLEAVHKAGELQPDLIVLDIGLPTLSGIEAARRIRDVSPESKILFISQESSADVVREAFSLGALGYVVKAHAGSDLLRAVEAVLQGKQFVSTGVTSSGPNAPKDDHAPAIKHCHEVALHADDDSVVDGYARFIESALKGGNVVVVIVTEAHRAGLLLRLEAAGVDVTAATKQGTYVPLDVADTLAKLTANNMPDPVRCRKVIGDLVMGASKGLKGEDGQVVVCGEIAPTLLSKGNAEGAIQLEHLWHEITEGYGVHTLCGYLWSAFPDRESSPIFRRICGEHSAVHGREQGCGE